MNFIGEKYIQKLILQAKSNRMSPNNNNKNKKQMDIVHDINTDIHNIRYKTTKQMDKIS